MLTNNNKQKKGVTIFELLIVVAAAVGIIATALALFSSYQDKQRGKDATSNIASLYSSISDLYYEDDTGQEPLSNASAIKAGYVPNGMKITGAATIENVFGGEVTITPGAGSSTNSFAITYKKVPSQETCLNLVRSQRKIGWDKFAVTDSMSGGESLGGADMSATTIGSITTACNGSSDYVTITFEKL